MAETRRRFDRELREGAVRIVRETGKPIAQVTPPVGRRRTLAPETASPLTPMTWHRLPAPGRAIAVAAANAVGAARAQDRDAYGAAVAALAATEGSALVLGTVVRQLLEDLHPDGLDSDDLRRIVDDCVRLGAEWQPAIDPYAMFVLLAGALGVHDQDEETPQPTSESLARHAPLLLSDLLTTTRRPLAWYLTAAFAEIERAERYD
jgi:hypothetical protein